MNLLGFILGVFLLFACTFSLNLHKEILSKPIDASCHNHLAATRKILNAYERQCFHSIKEVNGQKARSSNAKKENSSSFEKPVKHLINAECSRLNLWPLLEKSKEEAPLLYETAAHILRIFYKESLFAQDAHFEYHLLEKLLEAGRLAIQDGEKKALALETLSFQNGHIKQLDSMQTVYYRMLKGTKHTGGKKSFPPLIDVFVLEKSERRMCLTHASFEMLTGLFGSATAEALYDRIHRQKHSIDKEQIAQIFSESGRIGLSKEVLNLFELPSKRHRLSGKKILLEKEGEVSLRKQLYFPS